LLTLAMARALSLPGCMFVKSSRVGGWASLGMVAELRRTTSAAGVSIAGLSEEKHPGIAQQRKVPSHSRQRFLIEVSICALERGTKEQSKKRLNDFRSG